MERPGIIRAGATKIPESWFVRLDSYLKAITGRSSNGVKVNVGPGGTTYDVPSSYQAIPAISFPFQVLVGEANEDGVSQIGVSSDSHVINGSDKDAHEEDNTEWGLLGDAPDAADPGWFDCPPVGGKIWLQFEFDADGNLLGISLEWGFVGSDQWDEYPDPIAINTDDPENPYQEFYHLLLAEVTDPEEDPRPGIPVTGADQMPAQIVQVSHTNVMLVDATTTEDADEPGLPIMVAIAWSAPGTALDGSADEINAEDDVKTPWSFGSAEESFHFELKGRVDSDGQAYLSFAYGEINEVAPDTLSEGDTTEFTVDADGVVYASVTLDSQTLAVLSWYPTLAVSNEDVPEDTDDGTYITHSIIIGRFYLDDSGMPVPYNEICADIWLSARPTIAPDGRGCLEFFHTYTRAPLARDSFHLNVFNSADPDSSSLFLAVNDDDPENDKFLLSAAGNSLQLKWRDNPELWMQAAADGLSAKLDPWHLELGTDGDAPEVWLGRGSDDTWHLELPEQGYVSIDNAAVWLGWGDGGYHLELPSDGWISLGTTNINDGILSFDGSDSLEIYAAGWDVGQVSATADGVYIGSTSLEDGLLNLGADGSVEAANCELNSLSVSGDANFSGTLVIGGVDFATAVQTVVKGMNGSVTIAAVCNAGGGASGTGAITWGN